MEYGKPAGWPWGDGGIRGHRDTLGAHNAYHQPPPAPLTCGPDWGWSLEMGLWGRGAGSEEKGEAGNGWSQESSGEAKGRG